MDEYNDVAELITQRSTVDHSLDHEEYHDVRILSRFFSENLHSTKNSFTYTDSQGNLQQFDIDYFLVIKDTIRNYKLLNAEQLKYVKQLNDKKKNEIIDLFNVIVDSMSEMLK